jgi:hypothetical protein
MIRNANAIFIDNKSSFVMMNKEFSFIPYAEKVFFLIKYSPKESSYCKYKKMSDIKNVDRLDLCGQK